MAKLSDIDRHWRYYLALEGDLEDLARYIEFDRANYNTFSIELARILLAASSEVDVVLRQLCELLNASARAAGINEYRSIIGSHIPGFAKRGVVSEKYRLKLTPWQSWEDDENPDWWRSYNKVKHKRSSYFELANLENALNSVAALLLVNMHYAFQVLQAEQSSYPLEIRNVVSRLRPESELFRIDDPWAYYSD